SLVLQERLPPPAPPPPRPGAVVGAAIVYAAVAVFFVAVGIGSIRGRRWARTLMIVVSWLWLAAGVLWLGVWAARFPGFGLQLQQEAGRAGETLGRVVTWSTAALFVVLDVVLPAAFVLFYGSPHVKATCERRDPNVPWTDRCPAPVLAAALGSGATSVGCLVT